MNIAQFTLGQVVSVTTGRLACPIGDLYSILNHITGDNLYTHVLPRGARFAAPFLLSEFPDLANASSLESISELERQLAISKSINEPTQEATDRWLDWLRAAYRLPDKLQIQSHDDAWLSMNPVDELCNMVGKEKVAVLSLEKGAKQNECR